jgi:transposase, IS5 family
MRQKRYAQLSLGQALLFGAQVPDPEEMMDKTLRVVDELLDDAVLVERCHAALLAAHDQSATRGRKGAPTEVVLRMLVLRRLRQWTFEQVEWEVGGNLVYRYFCRLDANKAPDSTALIRAEQQLDGVLRELFERIVALGRKRGATRGRKLRVDTTVVEAPIRYPTDSRLCEDVVRVVQRELRKLDEAGVGLPFERRDVRRSVGRCAREISEVARRRGPEAEEKLKKPYKKLLRITGRLLRHTQVASEVALAAVERMRGSRRRKVLRSLEKLARIDPLGRQVVQQTRARVLRGIPNSPGKIISVFEPYAQILRRGKPHKPTEFGVMVRVAETEGGMVTDIGVVPEKNDAAHLVPSVEQHIKTFGRPPRLVSTDRGFYSTAGEARIRELGVKRAVTPRPGRLSQTRRAYERQRWFRRGRAWRAGGEARISHLKHRFGMARSPARGVAGMERTVLWAGIASNLAAIARSAK